MSDLTRLRDHARKMARPTPINEAAVTPKERALWTQIADEIDAYLTPRDHVDLFGEVSTEPDIGEATA
jgi:hypothetical protein